MWLDTFAHADGYATPEHGTLYETTTPTNRSITLLGTACLAYLGAVHSSHHNAVVHSQRCLYLDVARRYRPGQTEMRLRLLLAQIEQRTRARQWPLFRGHDQSHEFAPCRQQ